MSARPLRVFEPLLFNLPAAAFSLAELLVVVAILTLLAATQLPALTRAKAPVSFTRCMNNLRQIGQATMLYKADNNDCYPYGNRVYMAAVSNSYGWPMQLLHYIGREKRRNVYGYPVDIQPKVYICPSETTPPEPSYAFQLHYQSNRQLLSDVDSLDQPIRGSQVRKPASNWMFIEKSPFSVCSIRPGGFGIVLLYWNFPPGSPEYRRHNGGTCTAAADGHAEWLRMPPYLADNSIPLNFLELGDCAQGANPASSWARDNPHNGLRVKLWSRYNQKGF